MESNENLLMKKLDQICGNINANTLTEKLTIYGNGEKEKNKKNFYLSLVLLIKENRLVDDSDLLGYKNIICEKLLAVFKIKKANKNKYRDEIILDTFLDGTDDKFKKLLYFSFLAGKKKDKGILYIFFSILKEKRLNLLNKLNITNIFNNEYFIFLIDKNDINKLKSEIKKNIKDVNLDVFIQNSKSNSDEFIFGPKSSPIPENKIDDELNHNNNANNINMTTENNINIINIQNNNNIIHENSNLEDDNIQDIHNESIDDINNENNNIFNSNSSENENNKNNESSDDIFIENKINIKNKNKNNIKLMDENFKNLRNERIKELINPTLSISYNNQFQEETFIDSNYKKFKEIKDSAKLKDILFDCYNNKDKTKLCLFSPISLLTNNMKLKFEKNDLEIFNDDNHYIELFGLYAEELLDKLNSYINEGKNKDFIINNKIKFGCYHNHYYICCQISDEFKQNYYKEKPIDQNSIKNNIPMNDKKDKIQIIKVKEKKRENSSEKSNDKNLNDNEKDDENENMEKVNEIKSEKTENSTYSFAKIASKNYRNKLSYEFEKIVNDSISDEDCEGLQNIILFFNLKIPKINQKKGIGFKSIRLSFSPYPISLYGFREIDICFKNKNERKISKNEILTNNIYYINKEKKFKQDKYQEIDVSLKKDAIIFCEVKNSFPNFESGNEKCSQIQIENPIDNDINNIPNFTYTDQLENLYKKSKLFYNFFAKEKKIGEGDFIHILFLYDESNVTMWSLDYGKILKKTDDFLQKQQSSIKFKNIIFQIAYFDKIKYEQYIKKYHQNIIEDKNKEIQSTKDALKNKENEIEKNRQKLHAQEQQIKEQEQKLLEIEEENKKLKDKLKDLLAEKNINYNDPKSNK